MVSWQETFEVFPAILVVGSTFALTQFFWSNYMDSSLVDIMGAVISIVATVVFLRFWRPKKIWRFDYDDKPTPPLRAPRQRSQMKLEANGQPSNFAGETGDDHVQARSYPFGTILKAWMPFAILSVFVLVWGLPKSSWR